MNLPNPHDPSVRAALATLHQLRGFSPTDRQLILLDALLSAPCPPNDQDSGADRLTVPAGSFPLPLDRNSGYPAHVVCSTLPSFHETLR